MSVSSVKFNGVEAAFTVDSDSQITAVVPEGATSGPITVTNSSGTGASNEDFLVSPEVVAAYIMPPGDRLRIVFSRAVDGDESGFALSSTGGAVTLDAAEGSGTQFFTVPLSRSVDSDETITLSYDDSPGSVAAANDGAPLKSFSGFAVANDPLRDDLTAYWYLNDTNGTTWQDSAYEQNPMVESGNVTPSEDGATISSVGILRPVDTEPFAPLGSFTWALRFSVQDTAALRAASNGGPVLSLQAFSHQCAYQIQFNPMQGFAKFVVPGSGGNAGSPAAVATVSIASVTDPQLQAGIFLAAYINRSTNKIGLRINSLAAVEANFSDTLYPPENDWIVAMGSLTGQYEWPTPAVYKDVGFWDRALTSGELDRLAAGEVFPWGD